MIPWELLDTAQIPNGGGELRLKRRGAEFSIMLGSNELMNSRLSGSEQALATLACKKLASQKNPIANPHVLIGGLGMGFTLRAALEVVGPKAKFTIAELVPAVIVWAKGPMREVFGPCLSDPRVNLFEGDVGQLIRFPLTRYDAILLDVDNGPEGLTRKANDSLYDGEGLNAAYDVLNPGGVLTVWSSGPDPLFTQRLRKAGFVVDEVPVRAHGKAGSKASGARHMIWVASRS
jgi:spermidine synthase